MNEHWNKVTKINKKAKVLAMAEPREHTINRKHSFKLGIKHTIAWKDVESITCENIAAPIIVMLKSGTPKTLSYESYYAEYGDIGCTQMLANTLSESFESYLEGQAA